MNRATSTLAMLLAVSSAAAVAVAEDARPAPAGPAAASPELVARVQKMLDEGFGSGPKRIQATQQELTAAKRQFGDDPRLDYAYALVLLKHGQDKHALVQFETAVKRPGPAYWPAWQALIRGHFVDHQYEKGLKRLDEYAALVARASLDSKITEAQRMAAAWIGETLDALDKTVMKPPVQALIAQHRQRTVETLGEELREDLERGRDKIAERDIELWEAADKASKAAEARAETVRDNQEEKLTAKEEKLTAARDKAAKNATQWKEWLDEQLPAVDKEFAALEKEYQRLDKRRESLQQSITLVGREITSIQMQSQISSTQFRNQNPYQLPIGVPLNYLAQRQNALLQYQTEHNATLDKLTQTSQQGARLRDKRAEIVRRYEQATGDLVKQNADLDKWNARVAEKRKKLDIQAAGKGKNGKAATDESKTFPLKAYLPFDPAAERVRMLTSLGVSPPEEAEPQRKE